MAIVIKLNGQETEVTETDTIVDLLRKNSIPIKFCAVELNGEVIPRTEHVTKTFKSGDNVEVVTLVGGG
jgi:sulfur carrier protein